MYKNLIETEDQITNQFKVDKIKDILNKIRIKINNTPENNTLSIEENKKIGNIVEKTLEFNQQNQEGKGLNTKPNA